MLQLLGVEVIPGLGMVVFHSVSSVDVMWCLLCVCGERGCECDYSILRTKCFGWWVVLFLVSSIVSYYVERLLFEFIVEHGSVYAQCFVSLLYLFHERGEWEWVSSV